LEPILHFSTWTWSNLALSAPWSLPLTSPHQLHNLHWTWFELNNPNHAMPWHGMPPHAISSPGHLGPAPPCPLASPHSPGHARTLPWSTRRMHTPEPARPVTPRQRPCHARARMAPALDAPERAAPRRLSPSLVTSACRMNHLRSRTPPDTTTSLPVPCRRRGGRRRPPQYPRTRDARHYS
jgi:hypothetical protein